MKFQHSLEPETLSVSSVPSFVLCLGLRLRWSFL